MNSKHKYFLDMTLARAKTVAPVAGARMSAVICIDGVCIAGDNSKKTHPLQAKFGKNDKAVHLHAEIAAIKNSLRFFKVDELEGSTMYIARAKADGSPGLAKPCEGCQRALIAFGIDEIYWTE